MPVTCQKRSRSTSSHVRTRVPARVAHRATRELQAPWDRRARSSTRFRIVRAELFQPTLRLFSEVFEKCGGGDLTWHRNLPSVAQSPLSRGRNEGSSFVRTRLGGAGSLAADRRRPSALSRKSAHAGDRSQPKVPSVKSLVIPPYQRGKEGKRQRSRSLQGVVWIAVNRCSSPRKKRR